MSLHLIGPGIIEQPISESVMNGLSKCQDGRQLVDCKLTCPEIYLFRDVNVLFCLVRCTKMEFVFTQ